MTSGALETLRRYLNKDKSWYTIFTVIIVYIYIYRCLQASGKGYVSGTFRILLGNEEFQIDFRFSIGGKPTFDTKKLTSGPDTVVIVNGPTVENFTAHVSFKISRSPQSNYDFNTMFCVLTFLCL